MFVLKILEDGDDNDKIHFAVNNNAEQKCKWYLWVKLSALYWS